MTPESEQIQKVLDEAFARFRAEHPEVAASIEATSVPFAEYLAILSHLNYDTTTTTGNAQTPI
jgi:hypothetical protein